MNGMTSDCIDFSLKFAMAGGIPALIDATKRQMAACGVPDGLAEELCLVIGELFLDILENGYPNHRGYLALSCSFEEGELCIRITDHAGPRNILQEDSPLASLIQSTVDEATHLPADDGNVYEMRTWIEA